MRGKPRPCVPQRVGKYRVEEKLGAGGAGEVWAAHDDVLSRRVALKLVPRGHVGTEQETRLLREAHALAKLSHPNVVTVHDADRVESFVYIAMELVEGGTLKDAFSDPNRGVRERIALLRQAARGLHAAHTHGLVHRDFKPANALVGRDGRVRVADFGLARLAEEPGPSTPSAAEDPVAPTFSELTITGAILGTPAYMSPEQRLGCPLTPATDQFSFCVVAWLALYGSNPLADLDLAAWMAGEASIATPPNPGDVPAALHEALVRGLEPDPDARHPSMTPLIRALTDALDPPLIRRAPWVVAGVVVIALVLGSIVWPRAPEGPCDGLAIDWPAVDRPVLASALLDGTEEGVAAARAATAGLGAFGERWAAEAESTCRTGGTTSTCAQQQRAAFSTVASLVSTDGGRVAVPELLATLESDCDEGVTPTTVELARLRPRLVAGDAATVVTACIELERFDQDTPKVRAEILTLRGAALWQQGDVRGALETVRIAYNNAERAGDRLLAAQLAAEFAILTAVELGQASRSRVWLDIAEEVVDPPRDVEVSLLMARGRVLDASGAWSDAAEAFRRAAELQRSAPPYLDGPAEAQLRAAASLIEAGRTDNARPLVEAALERRRRVYGPAHAKTRSAQRILARL